MSSRYLSNGLSEMSLFFDFQGEIILPRDNSIHKGLPWFLAFWRSSITSHCLVLMPIKSFDTLHNYWLSCPSVSFLSDSVQRNISKLCQKYFNFSLYNKIIGKLNSASHRMQHIIHTQKTTLNSQMHVKLLKNSNPITHARIILIFYSDSHKRTR